MQRRALLRGLMLGVPASAGAAAAMAVKTRDYAKTATGDSVQALRERVDALKARFEQSERVNKKLIKAALVIAALSLGLDLSALF